MLEISISKISKSYGFKNILDNFSLDIKSKEKVCLIGENGCGKSTLLNIIAGVENQSSGLVTIRNGAKVGYLRQSGEKINDIVVYDYLLESIKNIIEIEERLKKLEENLYIESNMIKYCNLQDKYQKMGGYEIRSKIDKIVAGFKINHLLNLNYNTLSGGEKKIVDLAKIMINQPDILLLDEPTNHLDIETLCWFEDYLKRYDGTIVIVSHDRYFIDRIATKVVLIERGHEYIFFGNYSYYLKENENRLLKEFQDYKDQQKLIQALNRKIKQLEEFGKLAYPGGESFFRRAESIRKRLEKIEKISKPLIKSELPIDFNNNDRSGNDVLLINNYDLMIGDRLLVQDININISYKERVCILGKNGCGKSTLIKRIIDNSSDDNIKFGSNIKIGYVPQEIVFDKNISILDYAREFFNGDGTQLRSSLNKFYFCRDNVFKRINKLSGGEKVRLKLFELMQKNINLLILDEPTNHIDISTKEILEEALSNFNGTIIFISHDRYFINKIANKIMYINDCKIKEFVGNYDDFNEYLLNK